MSDGQIRKGDRVTIVGPYSAHKGRVGTVTSVDPLMLHPVSVLLDGAEASLIFDFDEVAAVCE